MAKSESKRGKQTLLISVLLLGSAGMAFYALKHKPEDGKRMKADNTGNGPGQGKKEIVSPAAAPPVARPTPAQLSLAEFSSGKTNVFATLDRTNFQGGLRLKLSCPASWKIGETNVTDKKAGVIRIATFSNPDGDVLTLALGHNQETLDREKADKEISRALLAAKVGLAVAPGLKRIASDKTLVGGQPGFFLEMTARDSKKKEHTQVLMEMALARTNSATMIFALTGGLGAAKQVDEKFEAYRPLFDGILKSVSISE